jgi:hypothetical protein
LHGTSFTCTCILAEIYYVVFLVHLSLKRTPTICFKTFYVHNKRRSQTLALRNNFFHMKRPRSIAQMYIVHIRIRKNFRVIQGSGFLTQPVGGFINNKLRGLLRINYELYTYNAALHIINIFSGSCQDLSGPVFIQEPPNNVDFSNSTGKRAFNFCMNVTF